MTKKKGVIGRLESPRERQYNLRRLLMRHYWQNPEFMADLSALMERWRDNLAEEIARWEIEADKPHGPEPQPVLGPPAYQKELQALTEKWGLRCPWAFPWLHRSLIEHLWVDDGQHPLCPMPAGDIGLVLEHLNRESERRKTFPPPPSFDLYPPVVRDGRRWVTASQKAEDDFRQHLEQVQRSYLARGYTLRDAEPGLTSHVGWLFQRIALKKVPRQIAIEEGVGQDAVEKAIYRLARELSIRLPRNKGLSPRR